MAKVREEKFVRYIQKELGYIFLQQVKLSEKNVFISVTRVATSPDFGYVKVYLSFLNALAPEKLLEEINGHMKEIRLLLGNRIRHHVRKIPELSFYYDDTMDYVEKMDRLFKDLDKNQQPEGKE